MKGLCSYNCNGSPSKSFINFAEPWKMGSSLAVGSLIVKIRVFGWRRSCWTKETLHLSKANSMFFDKNKTFLGEFASSIVRAKFSKIAWSEERGRIWAHTTSSPFPNSPVTIQDSNNDSVPFVVTSLLGTDLIFCAKFLLWDLKLIAVTISTLYGLKSLALVRVRTGMIAFNVEVMEFIAFERSCSKMR